jgi:hypothetical protein
MTAKKLNYLLCGAILCGSSFAASARQESSARHYAETVNEYVNIWIKKNHPNNPILGTPEKYMKDGIMWYQTGVELRQVDDKAKGVSKKFKKETTLKQVTESCTDSTIDNTSMLGSVVATKAIIKACIATVMDGYTLGQ